MDCSKWTFQCVSISNMNFQRVITFTSTIGSLDILILGKSSKKKKNKKNIYKNFRQPLLKGSGGKGETRYLFQLVQCYFSKGTLWTIESVSKTCIFVERHLKKTALCQVSIFCKQLAIFGQAQPLHGQ